MKNNTNIESKTNFINLTEMWQDGYYNEVGGIISGEAWSPSRVAEFCSYFCRHLGVTQLNTLYKFL